MIAALLATAVVLAIGAAFVYWYACAVAESDIARRAPQYATLLFRDHIVAFAMRLAPVRLSVLLRQQPPPDALELVSPLKMLGLIHLGTLILAGLCIALWVWLG